MVNIIQTNDVYVNIFMQIFETKYSKRVFKIYVKECFRTF